MELIWDTADSNGKKNVLRRARRLSDLRWTPARPLEENERHFLTVSPADGGEKKEYLGAPYSSARNGNRFMGLDVPLGAFNAALANPFSDLYRRDLSDFDEPYYTCCVSNAFLFYGTVCSAFVNYALHLPLHRSTHEWGSMPGFDRVEPNDAASLRLCDTLVTTRPDGSTGGHVRIVTGIGRDARGAVCEVEISEGTVPRAIRAVYGAREVEETLLGHGGNYLIFRYEDVDAVTDPPEPPTQACPEVLFSMGAGAVIGTEDPVLLAVTGEGGTLVIESDGETVEAETAGLPAEEYDGKTYRIWKADRVKTGEYRVSLRRDGKLSFAGRFWAAGFAPLKLTCGGKPAEKRAYRLCTPEGAPLREDSPCLYGPDGALLGCAEIGGTDGSRVISLHAGLKRTEGGILVRLAAHVMRADGTPAGTLRVGEDEPFWVYAAKEHSLVEVSFDCPKFCEPSYFSWREERDISYFQRMLTGEEKRDRRVTSELIRHDTDVTHVMIYYTCPGGRIGTTPVPIVID